MQAVKSDSPGTSLSWLCDLGKVTSPVCALVSVPEMEPTTTRLLWELELDVILHKQCMAHSKRSVNAHHCYAQKCSFSNPSFSSQTESMRQSWSSVRAPHFPCHLLAAVFFSQVCLLERTLPCFVPSAYELSQTSYLIRLLKNWLLRVTVTHVHFHQWIRGHCSSFDTSFIQ